MYNTLYNPYINPVNSGYGLNQSGYNPQKQEIIKVNGEAGARAYPLQANSSVLMLDETQPLLWLKVTDGAGYPTTTAYKIEPYTPETIAGNASELEKRIKRLEDIINESDFANAKQSKSKQSTFTDKPNQTDAIRR